MRIGPWNSTERAVAAAHGISKNAVHRHKTNHFGNALAKAAEARSVTSAAGLVDLVEDLICELVEMKTLAKAEPLGKGNVEVRRCVESILKAVSVMCDLTGCAAPKQVQISLQTPDRAEAIQIACDTLACFAPHLLATGARITEPETAKALLLEGELPEGPPEGFH